MGTRLQKIIIRNVSPADIDACCEVERLSFPPSEAAEPESIARRIRIYPEGFLIALLEDRIVGMVNSAATGKEGVGDEAFKKMIGHDPKGHNIVVFSLAVLPEYRRQGVAGRLVEAFVKQADRLKKAKILLICKSELIAYYSRFGFRHQGLSDSRHGGAQWHEMVCSVQDGIVDRFS